MEGRPCPQKKIFPGLYGCGGGGGAHIERNRGTKLARQPDCCFFFPKISTRSSFSPVYLNIAAIVFCLFATSTSKSPEVDGNDRMEVSASPAAADGISTAATAFAERDDIFTLKRGGKKTT